MSAGPNAAPIRLGGPKQRAALAVLARRPGAVVSADALIEALWGEEPPPTAPTALQGHVSQLRRLLGAGAIVTREPGYLLAVDPDAVDASRFERLVAQAATLPPAERTEPLRSALALWHGAALADVAAGTRALHDLSEELDELRLHANEELFDARLELGQHVELVGELESFVRGAPTRERAVAQLLLALYRSGRQADALAAYRRFRQELNAELALEPTHALRDLERRILLQDPTLAPPAAAHTRHVRRVPLTVAAVGLPRAGDPELDAEAYALATARAREAVRLVFERHGAVVERAGGAVVGLFGTPTPNEDDAARALAAAHAALDAVAGSRAGVASGDAFGSESIAIEQALRLQAAAGPGAVEVDSLTRSRAQPRHVRLDHALAGRTSEQLRLLEIFDEAVETSRSALALVVGPPGIGKTRLAEEVAAAVQDRARVLRARCLSYGDGIGLLPAADLVRAAAGLPAESSADAARARLELLLAGDDRAAPAVEQLLAVLGLTDEPPDAAPGWAVRRLLDAVSRDSSTLVLIDDLHWAAPAFLEVVERLAEPADAARLVVATAREAPDVPAAVLELTPLAAAACAGIVADLLGGEVEPSSAERVIERAGGNPLFLEELVRDLRASGRLRLDGVWRLDDAEDSLPQSIRSLLAMRVERLPERERDLLGRCSVLGRSFTLAEIEAVGDDVDEPIAGLVAAWLLRPAAAADDLQFRHGLIRDAAYASLPLALRAELHARVAAGLDRVSTGSREREAFAVHHLDQAYRARSTLTPGDWELADAAAELATRAASLAHTLLAQGDSGSASTLLTRVLELDPQRPLATIELGRARYDAGDLAAADDAWSLATEDEALGARARVGRVEVRLHTDPGCDLEAAGAEIDALLVTLRERGDDDGVIEALLARAYVSLTRGRIAELDTTLDEALVLAQRAGRSRAEAEMLFLACGASWYGPRPVADGIRRCERVLADVRERPIVQAAALQALGVLRAMAGDPGLGRETVAESRAIRRDIGQGLGAAASAIDAGHVELLAGDYAGAERVLRAGHDELERLGEKGYLSTLAALLAEAVEAQGRPEEARALARDAAAAATPDDVASHVSWRVAEARALARLGAAEDAQAVARQAVEIADATDFSLLRADAWAALGDVDAAVEILTRKGLDPAAIRAWTRPA